MQPGDLSERVTIQQATRADDGMGGGADTWSTFAEVSARVRPLTGTERLMGAVEAPATYEFTIRRRTDLTEAMRVVWGGAVFNIRFIAVPPARDLYMTFQAERSVAT